MPDKPFSPAAERNQGPILEVLREHFADRSRVLEIGSGTGQHAVHFARALPQLVWQCSDVTPNLAGIRQWLSEAALPNTPAPLAFDVNDASEPLGRFDAAFSANTLHIMSWAEVQRLFERLPALLEEGSLLVVYGPFNYDGRFTSPSNAEFDASLRAVHPLRGIRDAEAVDALAAAAGFALIEDRAMPANNRCRIWRRTAGGNAPG
jgi:cyclopropane fatty-acyl-phospholipid synthase-like methyltransferase